MSIIKYGDYVQVPSKPDVLPLIGRVITVWAEWATVSIPIGGARKSISYRLDELTPLRTCLPCPGTRREYRP